MNISNEKKGLLTVVSGPMFAGKSTSLISNALNLSKHKIPFEVFKLTFDNRYADNFIVNHDGIKVPATNISSFPEIKEETKVILFDEVQFYTEPYYKGSIISEILALRRQGKDVFVYGLDMDWKGNPFYNMQALSGYADKTKKLYSKCNECGEKAYKTFKKPDINENIVELGEKEKYEPRCEEHWLSGMQHSFLIDEPKKNNL
jgi:thymidine kinase